MSKEKVVRTPKTKQVVEQEPSFFDLDETLAKELKAKSLAYRWINAGLMISNHGYHRSGWQVYQTTKTEKKGTFDFGYGQDPEGYIRRGDLILAVKPEEQQVKHRKKLKDKANLYNTNYNKKAAQELKEATRMHVYEGYEDNGSSSESSDDD